MKYITYTPSTTSFVTFKGYNFNYTQNVFLSTNNISNTYSLTTVNIFSTNPKLSASFPEFTGFYYYNYNIISNNELRVNICDLAWPGDYDIVLLNPAGYTKMSDENVIVNAYSITPTPTVTPTYTPTPTITISVTPTETVTPTNPTETPTPTITPSNTETPTVTPTTTPTTSINPTLTPTSTVTPTFTPTETVTPTNTPTVTNTSTPSLTPTNTPTVTVTSTEYIIISPTPSETPTETPTVTPTPTETPTVTPSITQTASPTVTPSYTAAPEYGYDRADNYGSTFVAGDNQGIGFDPWQTQINTPGISYAGTFVSSSVPDGFGDIDTNGKSFGMYANSSPTNSSVYCRAIRPPAILPYLPMGYSLSATLAVAFRNGSKGLSIDTHQGSTPFSFNVTSDQYRVNNTNLGFPYIQTSIFQISAYHNHDNNLVWAVKRTNDNASATGSIPFNVNDYMKQLKFFVQGTEQPPLNNLYFNSVAFYNDTHSPTSSIYYCAGRNDSGQLGLGNYNSTYSKFIPILDYDLKDILSSTSTTLILSSNNTLLYSGDGIYFNKPITNYFTPLTGNWEKIYGSPRALFALSANSSQWFVLGDNNNGCLGLGNNTPTTTFLPITGSWSEFYVGRDSSANGYSYALSANTNKWYSAGTNAHGVLARGSSLTDTSYFNSISGEWSKLRPCYSSSVIMLSANTNKLFRAGVNVTNLSPFTFTDIPVEISGDYSDFECSGGGLYALPTASNIWIVCGSNDLGSLGPNLIPGGIIPLTNNTPAKYTDDGGATFVSADFENIYANKFFAFGKKNNKLYGTGNNNFGQLGINTGSTSFNAFYLITGNWANMFSSNMDNNSNSFPISAIPGFNVTPTPTPSITPTNTPTPSITPSNTPTPTVTISPFTSPTPTETPTQTPTVSPTPVNLVIDDINNSQLTPIGSLANNNPVNFTLGGPNYSSFFGTFGGIKAVRNYDPSIFVPAGDSRNTNSRIDYNLGYVPDSFIADFDIRAGGGTGADGIFMYFLAKGTTGTSGTINGSYPTGKYSNTPDNDAYRIIFDEYINSITLYWNATLIGTFGAISNLDDDTWRSVRIVHSYGNFTVYINGVTFGFVNDSSNYSSRSKAGGKLGLGSFTGGLNNYHYFKNFKLQVLASSPLVP